MFRIICFGEIIAYWEALEKLLICLQTGNNLRNRCWLYVSCIKYKTNNGEKRRNSKMLFLHCSDVISAEVDESIWEKKNEISTFMI